MIEETTSVQVRGARLNVLDEGVPSDRPMALIHAGIADRRSSDGPTRAEIWPKVAHMIAMELPDEFAPQIVEFLAPLPRWS